MRKARTKAELVEWLKEKEGEIRGLQKENMRLKLMVSIQRARLQKTRTGTLAKTVRWRKV
jgi:hypothetical protein